MILTVVGAIPSPIPRLVTCPTMLPVTSPMTRRSLLPLSERKTMTLLTSPKNLGSKCPPSDLSTPEDTVVQLPERLAVLKLIDPLLCNVAVLRPDATTTTAPSKPIPWFPELAKQLLLNIRSKTPKILGRVPLILLSKMIEQGPPWIPLASRLFLLHLMHFGGVLTK